MSAKAISKTELKEAVNTVAGKLPDNVLFIAAARQVANGKIEIEFVQSRSLSGRTPSVLGLLNKGNAAFNQGKQVMRVWNIVTAEGFKDVFGTIDGLDIDTVFEACKGLAEDMRVPIMKQVMTMNIGTTVHEIKIGCFETIDVAELPKSIRLQLADENLDPKIKNRYILQTKEGELIVDALGNKVYRRFELVTGEREDVLVQDKKLISDVVKAPATPTSILEQTAKELVG